MIESIKNPLETLLQFVGKEIAGHFKKDGNNVVANVTNEKGLKVQLTLHMDGNTCQLFFAEQDDPEYDAVVVKDIALFSITKQDARRLRDYLDMQGVRFRTEPDR